jgi:protoheme IX farnesyltransferase
LMAWQYPHFMAIAWLFRRQYAEAGFKMTTTVEPTGRSAAIQSVLGMVVLAGCLVGLVYLIAGASLVGLALMVTLVLVVTYPMTAAAVRFWQSRDDVTARKLLRASLLQLPASLLLLTIAALVWGR